MFNFYGKYPKLGPVKPLFLILLVSAWLASCSNSSGGGGVGTTIEGTWYSECVDANLKPFPMYLDYSEGHVIMELVFDAGELNATIHDYSDSNCLNFLGEQFIFTGTYTIVDQLDANPGETVTEMNVTGSHPLIFYEVDFTTFYIIENGFLYMNDMSTSDVMINWDVEFSR
jgi:hypothetical protein